MNAGETHTNKQLSVNVQREPNDISKYVRYSLAPFGRAFNISERSGTATLPIFLPMISVTLILEHCVK